jgi:hypothetical protein
MTEVTGDRCIAQTLWVHLDSPSSSLQSCQRVRSGDVGGSLCDDRREGRFRRRGAVGVASRMTYGWAGSRLWRVRQRSSRRESGRPEGLVAVNRPKVGTATTYAAIGCCIRGNETLLLIICSSSANRRPASAGCHVSCRVCERHWLIGRYQIVLDRYQRDNHSVNNDRRTTTTTPTTAVPTTAALTTVAITPGPCDDEPAVLTTSAGVDFVRTPDSCFENLEGWPYESKYFEIDGLRQAYIDEGPADGEVILLLHGQLSRSYLYHTMIPGLVDAGYRVIVMDHLGMGRSDKPVDWCNSSVASVSRAPTCSLKTGAA